MEPTWRTRRFYHHLKRDDNKVWLSLLLAFNEESNQGDRLDSFSETLHQENGQAICSHLQLALVLLAMIAKKYLSTLVALAYIVSLAYIVTSIPMVSYSSPSCLATLATLALLAPQHSSVPSHPSANSMSSNIVILQQDIKIFVINIVYIYYKSQKEKV